MPGRPFAGFPFAPPQTPPKLKGFVPTPQPTHVSAAVFMLEADIAAKWVGLPSQISLIASAGLAEDQGQRGTCSAFAATGLAQYFAGRDLSEQHAYYVDWTHRGGDPLNEGLTTQEALYVFLNEGICDESVWPYNRSPTVGNPAQGPPPAGVASARRFRIASAAQIPVTAGCVALTVASSIASAKSPLLVSTPTHVAAGWDRGPYIDVKPALPNQARDHMIVVFGYDQDLQVLFFKNSWGLGWGAGGFGAMSFAYAEAFLNELWQVRP